MLAHFHNVAPSTDASDLGTLFDDIWQIYDDVHSFDTAFFHTSVEIPTTIFKVKRAGMGSSPNDSMADCKLTGVPAPYPLFKPQNGEDSPANYLAFSALDSTVGDLDYTGGDYERQGIVYVDYRNKKLRSFKVRKFGDYVWNYSGTSGGDLGVFPSSDSNTYTKFLATSTQAETKPEQKEITIPQPGMKKKHLIIGD
jgi:hypothetical protein